MIMVSVSTFNWSSIKNIRSTPITSNLVVFVTVLVVVVTHDLAQGVFAGVLMSAMFFAYKVSHSFTVKSDISECGSKRVYAILGQVFFASAASFVSVFNYKEEVSVVVIDLTNAHFWDVSAVDAMNYSAASYRVSN
jgi:SulP family sulfate permease